jgi:hypothetical protein
LFEHLRGGRHEGDNLREGLYNRSEM